MSKRKPDPDPDPGHNKNGPPKKRTLWKNRNSRTKTLPFVSSHMEDNVEVINFHTKSRGVLGLVFVQIIFEKCTKNFYIENEEVGTKTTTANL